MKKKNKKLKKIRTKSSINTKTDYLIDSNLDKSSDFNKFEYFNEDLPEENDEQFMSLEELKEEEENEEKWAKLTKNYLGSKINHFLKLSFRKFL